MTSIYESSGGLNADNWGTTMTKEQQEEHLHYVKNTIPEFKDDREDKLAEFRKSMKKNPEFDNNTDLQDMQKSFVEGFLPREKHIVNEKALDEVKTKHKEDIDAIVTVLNVMTTRIEILESEIKELKKEEPGFVSKIRVYLGI
jgi:hypothetical protein